METPRQNPELQPSVATAVDASQHDIDSTVPGADRATTPRSENGLAVAIQRLWIKLQVSSAYSPEPQDRQRANVINTLITVIEFLSALAPDAEVSPPALNDLLHGLVDLDRGTVVPLLQPAKLRGRPPNSLSDDLFRALPAAAMTLLMEDGAVSLELAARDVASRLSNLGYKSITGSQVAKWREKVMTEWPAENHAAARYQAALKLVRPMERREAVRFLLGCLPVLNPLTFPKKSTT